jgi:nucleotide-binding universal stress UspA family protein
VEREAQPSTGLTLLPARSLVPVDYSPSSLAALHFAVELAERVQATLDIVHVWDRPSYVSNVVMTTTESVSGRSLIRMIQENAQHDLDEFLRSAAGPNGTPFSGRLLSGDPASSLIHELKERKHDLVVVGTHGRTGLSHVLLGSVAERERGCPAPFPAWRTSFVGGQAFHAGGRAPSGWR